MSETNEPTVITYVLAEGAARAIEFYQSVFDAQECGARFTDPKGKIGHAEIRIGNSKIMLADPQPESGHVFSPTMFYISVADVDATVKRAQSAGAVVTRPVKDEVYGIRSGMVRDPFGHSWMISTPLEEVSKQELQRRVEGEYKIS